MSEKKDTSLPPPVPGRSPDQPAESTGRKVGQVAKAFVGRLRFIALFVIVGVVAAQWETLANYYQRWTRPSGAVDMVADQNTEYYRPMHR
jgi:hypothetical protein